MGALPKFWYYTNRFVLVLSWCKIQTEDYFYLHEPAPKKKIHAMRVLAHTISDMSNISSSSTASLLDHETHDLHMSIGARTCFDSAKKQTMATTKIIKKSKKQTEKIDARQMDRHLTLIHRYVLLVSYSNKSNGAEICVFFVCTFRFARFCSCFVLFASLFRCWNTGRALCFPS